MWVVMAVSLWGLSFGRASDPQPVGDGVGPQTSSAEPTDLRHHPRRDHRTTPMGSAGPIAEAGLAFLHEPVQPLGRRLSTHACCLGGRGQAPALIEDADGIRRRE